MQTEGLLQFPIRIEFLSQALVQKFKLISSALLHVRLFIPSRRISLHNQKYIFVICIRLSFIKVVAKIPFACFKSFARNLEKMQFFEYNFQKCFRPLMFLHKLYFCFQARPKQSYGEKCAGGFVKRKHFSNFLGMVPTFEFRISIVDNGENKFSFSSDCRKYKNFDQSTNFLDDPCKLRSNSR